MVDQGECRAVNGPEIRGGGGIMVGRRSVAGMWPIGVAFLLAAGIILFAALAGDGVGPANLALFGLAQLGALAAAVWFLGFRKPSKGAGPFDIDYVNEALGVSPSGWLVTTLDGACVYANRSYRRMVGAPEDGLAETLTQIFQHDSSAMDRIKRMEDAADHSDSPPEEFRLDLGGGLARRWISVLLRSVPSAPGIRFWFVRDTTEHHEMEATIRQERARLRDYFDNAPVGFYSVDEGGNFQFVNKTLADWLGYPRHEIGEGALRLADVLIREGGRGGDMQPILPYIGARKEEDAVLRTSEGRRLPVHVTHTIVRDDRGKAIGARSVVRDLSQEQAWQEQLKTAEMHFRRFFDVAPVGIVVVDAEGEILEGNAAFSAMTYGAAESGVGRPLGDLVAPEERDKVSSHLREALSAGAREGSGRIAPVEVRLMGELGRVVQMYASRLGGGASDFEGILLHLIDATEQKNLEAQFAQGQKMQAVGQLAGGIAHDFNNLLTAMIGFCDLLLLRHQPGDQSFSDIMQIKQNANRAANLVRQLLAFSRQQTLRPKVAVLTDILAELSHLLRRLMGEKIELKMVHGRDLWLVKVDEGQLEQVIINLAVNARDAMPDGGKLTIVTDNVHNDRPARIGSEMMPAGDYVLIQVSDTGTGIATELFDKIFDPFFTTKQVGAGTGLGLSTVYGIINQTGGFILPESTIGEGTSFSIYLPRYQPSEEERKEAAEIEVAHRDLTGKGTVLLVEDEDPVRLFAVRALRNKGYKVLEADSGETALDMIDGEDGTIDLLVTDVMMPGMDGPTLAKQVRQVLPDLKIIFISGYAEDTFRRNLDEEISNIEFLPKPFSLKELAGKVKEVMAKDGG